MRRCHTKARLAAFGFALQFFYPTSAGAQTRDLTVTMHGCNWLHADELIRLTRLEFDHGASPRIEVAYRCSDEGITIQLVDIGRDLRISRHMPRDCCNQSAERTLALLAAGLYAVASPVLSSSPQPSPPSSPPPSPPQPSSPPPGSAVQPPIINPTPPPVLPPPTILPRPGGVPVTPPKRIWQPLPALPSPDQPSKPLPPASEHNVNAAAQLRFYHIGDSTMLYGARLRYLYWPSDAFGIGPIAEADFGAVMRAGGQVNVRIFHVGAAAAWRFFRGVGVEASLSPFAAFSIVQLAGVSTDAAVRSDSLTGATGAGGLRLGGLFGEGGLRVTAMAEAGALFRAPRAAVAAQAPVQVDGIWLGFGLGIDLNWANTPPRTFPSNTAESRYLP